MDEARRLYGDRADLELSRNANATLAGSDGLAILTEWAEFRSPDFERIKKELTQPVIFDGRNLYDPAYLARLGIKYYGIGRGQRIEID